LRDRNEIKISPASKLSSRYAGTDEEVFGEAWTVKGDWLNDF
jgi:hypothetical protein